MDGKYYFIKVKWKKIEMQIKNGRPEEKTTRKVIL